MDNYPIIYKYSSYFRHSKLTILLALILLSQLPLNAQKIMTLKECYDRAASTSAIASEKTGYSDISKLKDGNLVKGWLPTIDANGSLLYNSSVVDMGGVLGSLPFPGIADAIKPLPHEQYKVTVDINQVLYDGGAIKGARELEKADLRVNEKQTETDLYKLRGQINGFYFNLMLLDRQKELLNNYLEIIKKRLTSIKSGIDNGVILKSDGDVLASEKIKIEQQLAENQILPAMKLMTLPSLLCLYNRVSFPMNYHVLSCSYSI
jgi:hypothetical protein